MALDYAIQTENLRKVYQNKVAVNQLNMTVNQGEIFGFLGPNGAGKTTTIKMLLGLTTPTSGTTRLLGTPSGNTQIRSKVGFLPEHFRFHEWLTANEFLELHGQLYGMENSTIQKRIPAILERVNLSPFHNQQLKTFSKGMLQRIGLAQALINSPRLVFLDEPTSGLDPVGRRMVRDIIHELRLEGVCVFLNSHLLSEVEVTCDRVAFIKDGQIIKVLQLDSLRKEQTQVVIRGLGWSEAVLDGLSAFGKEIRLEGIILNIIVDGEAILPALNRYLVDNHIDVFSLTPQRKSLEDYFIEIVGTSGVL